MCGRYTLTQPLPFVEHHYRLEGVPPEIIEQYRPRYNVAPGQAVLAALDRNGRTTLAWLRWGLIPFWAKEASIGNRLINARSETAAQKPAFRRPFRQRRCLLPADGFYEWRTEGRRKTPFRIRLRSGELFSLAGLWDVWQPPDGGEPLHTCTILTTAANEVVRPIHDRMPVIIPPDGYRLWLDPRSEPDALAELLKPYPAEPMEAYPVSTAVNSPRNDDPRLIEPVPVP